MSWKQFKRKPTVGVQRAKAEKAVAQLQKRNGAIEPVVIEGREIAQTFWGKAWCNNLQAYHDFASRLPRGRSYVTNRAVLDLKVSPGRVDALVQGTSRYQVSIGIDPLSEPQWSQFKKITGGRISSTIALLKGELSEPVMRQIIDLQTGLFPRPNEIRLNCDCPDWAHMCKHVAAVLYGVGNRLDARPELLFTLRRVDPDELITLAGDASVLIRRDNKSDVAVVADSDLADVFGIELDGAPPPTSNKRGAKKTRRRRSGARKPRR